MLPLIQEVAMCSFLLSAPLTFRIYSVCLTQSKNLERTDRKYMLPSLLRQVSENGACVGCLLAHCISILHRSPPPTLKLIPQSLSVSQNVCLWSPLHRRRFFLLLCLFVRKKSCGETRSRNHLDRKIGRRHPKKKGSKKTHQIDPRGIKKENK